MLKRNIKSNEGDNIFYKLRYFKNYDNFMV